MAVGIESAGIDLDSIFAAYTSNRTKAGITDIRYGSSNTDLNQRYENILYGTAAALTHIETNGVDLKNFFCAYGTDWLASLPSFPNPFTTSPQNGVLTITLSGGPGGTYTYLWSVTSTGAANLTINSGQGTNTITFTATGVAGEPGNITVTCVVTASSGVYVGGHTTMRFNIPPGGG